jgi:methionine aminotransferase
MSAHSNKYGAINLAQGFPNFEIDPELIDLVTHYMKAGYNQYAPMIGVGILRERIASKIEHFYSHKVDPDSEITVTAGATQAMFTGISAFCSFGDEVIIFEPAYDSYVPGIQLNGAKPIPYSMVAPDFKIDWDEVGKLISPKTKMIIINTPHNPSGTVLKEHDMTSLSELVRGTDIIILSDEVYEHLIFDGEEHQSIFLYPELYKRSLVVFSFGKTLHNTGWKMGYAVGPEELSREFRKTHQFNVFSVNTPAQYAVADYIKNAQKFEVLSSFFQKKRDVLKSYLHETDFDLIPCKGTYFLIADYSKISSEEDLDFAKSMSKNMGVATIPLSPFYMEKPDQKIVRFCFAKTEDMLQSAGEKLRKAFTISH